MAEPGEEGKVKNRSPEKYPKEELKGPVLPLGKEVPGGVKEGRNEDEKDAQGGQRLPLFSMFGMR